MINFLNILILILFFSGCSIPLPTDIKSTQNYVCLASANDFSGCCLGRGGAQTCNSVTSGYYFRSSDKLLVCGDGDVSTGCYQ